MNKFLNRQVPVLYPDPDLHVMNCWIRILGHSILYHLPQAKTTYTKYAGVRVYICMYRWPTP